MTEKEAPRENIQSRKCYSKEGDTEVMTKKMEKNENGKQYWDRQRYGEERR